MEDEYMEDPVPLATWYFVDKHPSENDDMDNYYMEGEIPCEDDYMESQIPLESYYVEGGILLENGYMIR